jgi:hypothetical protein
MSEPPKRREIPQKRKASRNLSSKAPDVRNNLDLFRSPGIVPADDSAVAGVIATLRREFPQLYIKENDINIRWAVNAYNKHSKIDAMQRRTWKDFKEANLRSLAEKLRDELSGSGNQYSKAVIERLRLVEGVTPKAAIDLIDALLRASHYVDGLCVPYGRRLVDQACDEAAAHLIYAWEEISRSKFRSNFETGNHRGTEKLTASTGMRFLQVAFDVISQNAVKASRIKFAVEKFSARSGDGKKGKNISS